MSKYKLITRFEKLQKMTIEEMAEFFSKNCDCINCAYYEPCEGGSDDRYECKEGHMEWLSQEEYIEVNDER